MQATCCGQDSISGFLLPVADSLVQYVIVVPLEKGCMSPADFLFQGSMYTRQKTTHESFMSGS